MSDEKFLEKYEELLNKDYCNCNEMNCIDNNSPRRILNIAKKQKEVLDKIKEYIDEHIKYECDNAFNGMQFYSYHLYDFNKEELLKLWEEIE